jgi:serine/threonine-protein kinase
MADLRSTASTWTPPHETNTRAAWDGVYPNQPASRIHVEAASYAGKPVFFEIKNEWDSSPDKRLVSERFGPGLIILLVTVFITVMVGSTLLAWRNLRLGRGDRKGALRLAIFVFGIAVIRWIFVDHHVAAIDEPLNFITKIQQALFWAVFYWVVYVAFEPFVRRRWPGRIISWSRLLAGGFRDPLVGRDLLIGAVFGLAVIFCDFFLVDLVPRWMGRTPQIPWWDFPATPLLGIHSAAHGLTQLVSAALLQSFVLLFLFFLLYILLRRDLLAAIAEWLLVSTALTLAHDNLSGMPFAAVSGFMVVWVLYRYGLLALIAALFFLHLVIFFPITSRFTAWYAGDFVIAVTLLLAVALYGFYTSLAGQPIFRGAIPDE